jgi:hypothetical protein
MGTTNACQGFIPPAARTRTDQPAPYVIAPTASPGLPRSVGPSVSLR